ncbi:hypothetical protein CWO91_27885 [Bradyrhizobium genosp. SA-3]|nr:hypothetical protein CWO91_27885 [Bradyrhizobium genosp. SA-3]
MPMPGSGPHGKQTPIERHGTDRLGERMIGGEKRDLVQIRENRPDQHGALPIDLGACGEGQIDEAAVPISSDARSLHAMADPR